MHGHMEKHQVLGEEIKKSVGKPHVTVSLGYLWERKEGRLNTVGLIK